MRPAGILLLLAVCTTAEKLKSTIMDLQLKHKTALVTASSGGIGLAIARSLAREGATVYVNGRTRSSVERAIAEMQLPSADLRVLVSDNSTAEGCAQTIAQLPQVDILVNNLGIYEAVGFFEESDEAWQHLFEVNIMSGVRLARHYLAGMLERASGRVIFISSESAVSPAAEMAHYSATKTMQLGISRSLAELTKGTAVTVNCVLPGPTRTANVEKFLGDVYPGVSLQEAERLFMQHNRPSSLLGRLLDVAEIADVVCFLSSPLSSAINGSNLRAEGGLIRSVF